MDPNCPKCGAALEESASLPEFCCPACKTVVPVPGGDDILFEHLLSVEAAAKAKEA
jgi:hypothetical protein